MWRNYPRWISVLYLGEEIASNKILPVTSESFSIIKKGEEDDERVQEEEDKIIEKYLKSHARMDSLRTKVTKRRRRGEKEEEDDGDDDDDDDDDEERKRFPKKWRDGCWLMRFNIGCQSDFSLICVFLSFSSSRRKETALHHEKNISIDRADHKFIGNDEIAVVDEINALPNFSLMLITIGVRDWNAHSRTERILLPGLDS